MHGPYCPTLESVYRGTAIPGSDNTGRAFHGRAFRTPSVKLPKQTIPPVPLNLTVSGDSELEMSAEASLPGVVESPSAKYKMRARRSKKLPSNQIKLTSMFTKKRSRSPDDCNTDKLKKIKTGPDSPNEQKKEEDKSNDDVTDEGSENSDNTEEPIPKSVDITMQAGCDSTTNSPPDDEQKKEDKSDDDLTDEESKNSDNTEEPIPKSVDGTVESSSDSTTNSPNNNDEDTVIKIEEIVENNNNLDEEKKLHDSPQNERCNICRQFLNNSDIIYYHGHPQNAVEEYIALTNEKLILASGDEGDITERPQTNITGFSIFDQEGHLVPIDGGLVENDMRIYMSGYLKSICSESPDIDEESVPVKDIGPIVEWYIHGFDGGMKNCITLSTEFGEYNLMKPSTDYTPLMNSLYEKICISKVIVEYLEEFHYLQPTYEDLLEIIREATIPELDANMTEEMLHKHAQFVCDQVVSLEAQDEEDEPLITLPCMRELIKLMGIKFGKRRHKTKIAYKKPDKKAWTRATTTPLVRKTFEIFFSDQLDKTNKDLVFRRKRCGVCEACQLPDCGACGACGAMAKFGGHGRTKQACVRRRCPNMAVQQAGDDEPEEDDYRLDKKRDDRIDDTVPVKLTADSKKITWLGDIVKADAAKIYYDKVDIDGLVLKNGDYVMVETSQANIPALVVRVVYMWKETLHHKCGFFHGEVFIRSSDTVLGEVGDPREVFLADRCCHGAPLSSILRKANIERKETPSDWFRLGGADVDVETLDDDGKTYFYKKYYERFTARFEDLPKDPECPNPLRKHKFCPSCERKIQNDAKNIPKVIDKLAENSTFVTEPNRTEWSSVRWQGHDYKKGHGVFLKPGTFKFKVNNNTNNYKPKLEKVDEDVYPEYYRKSDNNLRGSNVDTGEPFCVGFVLAVAARGDGPLVVPQDIYLKVPHLYSKLEKVDEDVYPEYYRKSDNNLRGSNVDTGEPFCVGFVLAVAARGDGPLVVPQDIYLKVPHLYSKLEKEDEDVYPEYYRKSDNNLRGSNLDTGEPFCVGFVLAVAARGDGPSVVPQDIYLKVNVLYRPENTASRFPQHEDLNVVYWSDDVREIPFSAVVGPCSLIYEKNIPEQVDARAWLERDPARFYFREAFDNKAGKFLDVPQHAVLIGRSDKGKDKGKGKGKSSKPQIGLREVVVRPLRTLDVFAGCGGLSDGLHQAGIAECRWAIENVEPAAHAYSLNNRSCTVFNEDCNALLSAVMAGASHSKGGQRLPTQGEVELLCGGPPCQGFSGMNRFNSREYSNFKNSLVASYLSYCDYYRPKYFILENVRNFVAFKKGMVLKLTLRTLLDMGYQCTFGILQAGNYGVPQTRRRLIVLAAAPGYALPKYPEPTHVFSRRACSLTATIDGKRFCSNIQWDESAPRRTNTIHDAMSDLPEIPNGHNKIEMEYGSMAESHFQRLVRSRDESAKLRDHVCKNMAPLIQARIARVPLAPGSDWRDLPNISVTLSDGTKCKVLQYRHHDKRNGRSSSGALRGVCACAAGGRCDPTDKQESTLIPWCLPHTANRHNNWAGLYGRVCWDGYFSTTVTDPEPMGKQGRVLHPAQHRVVSVRECARSQGFRDAYLLAGTVQDKHRQVGNAVPPPLGAALGREIMKALLASNT